MAIETLSSGQQDDSGEKESIPMDTHKEPSGNSSCSLMNKDSTKVQIDTICNSSKAQKHKMDRIWKLIGIWMFFIFYCVFVAAILLISSSLEKENYWCNGDGFVILVTSIGLLGVSYFKIVKPYIIKQPERFFNKNVIKMIASAKEKYNNFFNLRYTSCILHGIPAFGISLFLIIDCLKTQPYRLISGLGIIVCIAIGVGCSKNPKHINVKQVVWGITVQIIFGLLILRWPLGRGVFECLGNKVSTFLSFVTPGVQFTFGKTISNYNTYAFSILPMIMFFSMFVSILFYYGILQWMIVRVGWLLQITMGTTACESMAVAGNIFLGLSESPLLIYPYLPELTKSEFHAVLTGGYATVAGTVLGAYISFGIDAAHLLSASVMSAPAALSMAKLFYPETQESKTTVTNIKILKNDDQNVLHAVMKGLKLSLPLVANIFGCLIGFIAFNAFANSIVDWSCQLLNFDQGTCSIQKGLAYPLTPMAWLMGIPWEDCFKVGYLLATKFFVSEFVAYKILTDWYKDELISNRSVEISTYALCGFSSLASLGCAIGVYTVLVPSRTRDVIDIGFRALIAGSLACYLTACVAGLLIPDSVDDFHATNATLSAFT